MTGFNTTLPSAFIFHTSRCGSTLFAKALATDPANVVINQPGPFQHGFWAKATNGFSEPLTMSRHNLDAFRTLLLLMSRRRRSEHETVFVKFISWNALYIDFIMNAFPDVPTIFLYRDPVEIIASVRNSATAILQAKDRKQAELLTGQPRAAIDRMGPTEYLAICYRRFFETITTWQGSKLALLDYSELTQDRFADILSRSFGITPSPDAIEQMQAQFTTYSKDDDNTKTFDDDRESKRNSISKGDLQLISKVTNEELRRLRLDRRNLFVPTAVSTDDSRLALNMAQAFDAT